MTIRGSCLCGGVAYEIDGKPRRMVNCHCSRCRKAHGAAYVTFMSANAGDFKWLKGEELISEYASENWNTRPFCRICGGNLPMLSKDSVVVPAGSLDDDPGHRPAFHIFVASKAPFHEIADDLVTHDEYPSE